MSCNLCGSELGNKLDFGQHPIANLLSNEKLQPVSKHSKALGRCKQCELIQLVDPLPPNLLYADYPTTSSWKPEPHINKLINNISALLTYEDQILDVGCNDGKFLSLLRDSGFVNLKGLEPTANTALTGQKDGFMVFNSFLTEETACSLLDQCGPFQLVTVRAVLEHIINLSDFGRALNTLIKDKGFLVVEVPDMNTMLAEHDYAIWEEHCNHFTTKTLSRFLSTHGFDIVRQYSSLFSGDILTVIAQKNKGTSGSSTIFNQKISAAENDFANYVSDFPYFKKRITSDLEEYLSHENSRRIVLYGVGGRSTSFINILDIGKFISFAIDDQIEKQNKFLPGSDIPIISGSDAASCITDNDLVLLGVNAENEDGLLEKRPWIRKLRYASILPPSAYLLSGWSVFNLQNSFNDRNISL